MKKAVNKKATKLAIDNFTQKVIDGIKLTAATLEVEPWEVARKDILNHTNISSRTLDCSIGLTAIKKTYFPKPIELGERTRASYIKKYTKELEGKVGVQQYLEDVIKKQITNNIKAITFPKKQLIPKIRKQVGKLERVLVGMLNDTHYGLNVNIDEVAGLNSYGWKEATRRTASVVDQLCNFKRDHRSETDTLHLILNGDILAGIIHGLTSKDLQLLSCQMNGALHILTHAINYLSQNFNFIEVHFQVGNHGDMPHRRDGGRVVSQVYDNYEAIVYYALSAAFRNNKRINFNFSRTLFGTIDLPAGRLIYTHGHLLFSKSLGNPGSQIKVKNLSDSIMRFNSGEVAKGNPAAKMVLVGHTHVSFSLVTSDGVRVVNAPSLSGVDPYAQSLDINNNLTEQLIFESTPSHIFGDNRYINVSEADNNNKLDTIIPLFNNDIVWKG